VRTLVLGRVVCFYRGTVSAAVHFFPSVPLDLEIFIPALTALTILNLNKGNRAPRCPLLHFSTPRAEWLLSKLGWSRAFYGVPCDPVKCGVGADCGGVIEGDLLSHLNSR
jgi:hypothetical protein